MKILSRFALVVVLLAAAAGVASAAYTGPFWDGYVNVGGSVVPSGNTLYVQDSLGTCNDSQITYFQFDASNIATVTSATLKLTAASVQIGLDTTPQLSIYGVTDFEPAALTGSNAPLTAALTPIQTIPIPSNTVVGTPFTFGGVGSALAGHIADQANGPLPQTVTLALSFSASCNGNNSQMNFYSQEYSTNTAYRPQLTIEGTKKVPNAVDMSATSAERVTWPLYAGLAAVAVAVIAGLAISRRRTA